MTLTDGVRVEPVTAGRGGEGDPSDDALVRAWSPPPGLLGRLAAVNHKAVAMRFIVTAFVFLLIGGIEAMLIRLQLARPESDVLSAEAYNETFTMHGSTMMFLFAVPMLEGLMMYLAPLMVGTRDMPFPRLNAFGYWSYLFGGILFYSSIFAGDVPDGGWFAYPPLTGPEHSPDAGADFWLLGVTFVEVAGIVGAIELIVLVLKHRAPGMSLDRMPLFVWATLVTAVMMLFAFTTLAVGSVLLELERTLGLPFYDPDRGGEPLLWQHIFWIFGHPEVYIMFLPAAGIVSMLVATSARRPIVGYPFLVVSLVAVAFLSFGLWVHHMFTTGIPFLATTFFTAASMVIAIPNGIQIFAWLTTLREGRVRWSTPLLFVIGFFVTFVAGGITGVMVAMVPFDWQVHDSFFVVAHFHYVLVGGVLFPVFAGLHYWWPKISGRMPSEALGRVAFWLTFVGFNVAFFPQHVLGLWGMPRRVYTYEEGWGWGTLNLLSSVAAFVLAAGVLVFAVNLLRTFRVGRPAGENPWEAGTLEWATASPPAPYNFRRLPVVADREPLWFPAEPDPVQRAVQEELLEPHEGLRETWATDVLDGEPQEIVHIAQPSLWPLAAAAGVALALVGILASHEPTIALGSVAAAGSLLAWLWPSGSQWHREAVEEAEEAEEVARIVTPAPTRRSGVWVAGMWGALLGGVVLATALVTLVFSYTRLAASGDDWPPEGFGVPDWGWAPVAAALLAVGVVLVALAARRPAAGAVYALVGAATVAAVAAAVLLVTYWDDLGLSAEEHAFGAITVALIGFAVACGALLAVASSFVLARLRFRPHHADPAVPLRTLLVLWVLGAGSAVVGVATVLSPQVTA